MRVHKVVEVEVPDLAKKIRRARKESPYTITQLCASADMTTSNWYRIESGEAKSIPLDTLRRIEQVLDVNFGVLL